MKIPPIPNGTKFERLTILSCLGIKNRYTYYRCRCDCGVEKDIQGVCLTAEKTRSCGCIRKGLNKKPFKPRNLDCVGKTYGNWTILSSVGKKPEKDKYKGLWLCRCICGNELEINRGAIHRPNGSCGCARLKDTSAKNHVLAAYKCGAKRRKLLWGITDDQAEKLFISNCGYCGTAPSNTVKSKKRNFVYNGIDRVDNTKGYVFKNCIACCKICNLAKRDLPLKDFLKWINKVYNRVIKKFEEDKLSRQKLYPGVKCNKKEFWEI